MNTTPVAQAPFELATLLGIVDGLSPSRILEVGVWHGGTLRHWLREDCRVVAVDDAMLEASQWVGWADDAGADLHLVQGSSSSTEVAAAVDALGPFDFAFIDAGHTYGVSQLWNEIKSAPGARTVEIVQRQPYDAPHLTEGYAPGIGVVWV